MDMDVDMDIDLHIDMDMSNPTAQLRQALPTPS